VFGFEECSPSRTVANATRVESTRPLELLDGNAGDLIEPIPRFVHLEAEIDESLLELVDLGAGIADCQLVEHRQGPISRRQHRVTPDTPEASRQDGPRGYR
jgi:hypothetical protein